MNKKLAIIISIVLAIVFTAGIYITATAKYREASKTVDIVKVKDYIAMGDTIAADDIEMVEVQEDMSKNHFTNKSKVIGKTPVTSLVKNQFIVKGSLKPAQQAKKEGFVEVFIPVEISSSAMALTGEEVDIHLVNKNNREATEAPALYKGAKVLHSLSQDGTSIKPNPDLSSKIKSKSTVPASIGVEVPADIADKLVQYAHNDAVYLVKSEG